METIRQKLVETLERTRVQDDADGLWLIFDNGKQEASVNIGSPGPIVRAAVLGWYRQAKAALDNADSAKRIEEITARADTATGQLHQDLKYVLARLKAEEGSFR